MSFLHGEAHVSVSTHSITFCFVDSGREFQGGGRRLGTQLTETRENGTSVKVPLPPMISSVSVWLSGSTAVTCEEERVARVSGT